MKTAKEIVDKDRTDLHVNPIGVVNHKSGGKCSEKIWSCSNADCDDVG